MLLRKVKGILTAIACDFSIMAKLLIDSHYQWPSHRGFPMHALRNSGGHTANFQNEGSLPCNDNQDYCFGVLKAAACLSSESQDPKT